MLSKYINKLNVLLFKNANNFAINGYDTVSYFMKNKALRGSENFSTFWNNKIWLFNSKENLDLFLLKPAYYSPQYDGNCAYGCSEGHAVPADPTAWTIFNDKLYFNYNKKVRRMWLAQDVEKRILAANNFWANK